MNLNLLESFSKTNIHSETSIKFKRVNPTKYIIEVENATHPFFIVLLESYNKG